MSHREALKPNTLLAFPGMACRIESLLGSGRNAFAYLGRYPDPQDPARQRTVLIKELFPQDERFTRDPQGALQIAAGAEAVLAEHRQHFLDGNEIHSRLLLDHPELSAGISCFPYQNTLYALVEFPEGRTWKQELQARPGDLRQYTLQMLKLLDAVEAVHKCGFLHLDIRPDTVMLTNSPLGTGIFLMDCNSTMPVDYQTSSYLNYRPGYSAPEVENSSSGMADFSSDLYSVTAVFYHALMGRPLSLEEMLLSRPPDGQDSPCLTGCPPVVRSKVRSILRKGLCVLPARRYRSTGQMRNAFLELLERIDHPENFEAEEAATVVTALPRRRRPLLR